MRLKSSWTPRLASVPGPTSDRLVQALAEDIQEGVIAPESRLPAHRDLAYRLGIGLGTVTKAYGVLERRGLIQTIHGRGSFVASLPTSLSNIIDMSVNTPPSMLSEKLLAKTLATLSRKIDMDLFRRSPPIGGALRYRRVMSQWLASLGLPVNPDRLLLCNGAQQALAIAFSMICRDGGTIITEANTYSGAIALARYAGYQLVGVAIDEEGMIPDDLEKALHAVTGSGNPYLVYVTPTLQNPTTTTMGQKRRQEIIQVCRQYSSVIVEDDVYTLSASPVASPLAVLAPECVFYVSSLSKTLSPGLRIGTLVVPPEFESDAEIALRASAFMVSGLSCALMEHWLADGTAESVRLSILEEAQRRCARAHSILTHRIQSSSATGFHVWLPMRRAAAERFHLAAAAIGIKVTAPGAVAVYPQQENSGIRLCLGGLSLKDLSHNLQRLAEIKIDRGESAENWIYS